MYSTRIFRVYFCTNVFVLDGLDFWLLAVSTVRIRVCFYMVCLYCTKLACAAVLE